MATEKGLRDRIRDLVRREHERQELPGRERVDQALALRDFAQKRIHPRIRKEVLIAGGLYRQFWLEKISWFLQDKVTAIKDKWLSRVVKWCLCSNDLNQWINEEFGSSWYDSLVKIVYTKHALGKFKHPSVIKLGIKRAHIKMALTSPDYSGETKAENVLFVLKNIDSDHDLRVIYTKGDIIKIITFYPTEKGRYEG